MTGTKRYVVQNPRNIPRGTRVARNEGKEFHEGDTISSDEIDETTQKAWLARGQIKEQ